MAENPDLIATDKQGRKLSDASHEVNGIVPGEGGSAGDADIAAQDDGNTVLDTISALNFVAGVNVSDAGSGVAQVDVLVDTQQISDGAVATAKLATSAVTQQKLDSESVGTTELIQDAVTNVKIATDAVDTAQLANSAVDSARLASSAVTAAKVASDAIGSSEIDLSIAPTWTGEHSFEGGLTGLPTPSSASDAATKEYADALKSGLDYKDPVEAATDGTNIDLTSTTDPNPIDGYTLADGDRVLLKDQTDGTQNGLYVASTATDPSTWVRTSDADEDSEVTEGLFTFVENGSINGSRAYILITESPTLGTDALDFAIFSDAGSITAGNHLSKNGSELNVTPSTIPVGDLNNVTIQAMLEGLDADKPGAGTAGRFYWATDTRLLYRDDGTSWVAIGGRGTSSDPLPEQYVQSMSTDDRSVTNLGANAHPSSAQTVSNSTITKLNLDATRYDHRGEVDTTNNNITVSEAGKFKITGQALFDSVSDQTNLNAYIYINGSIEVQAILGTSGSANAMTFPASVTVELTTGDTVDFRVQHNEGTSLDIFGNNNSYLEVIKLG